MYIGVPKQGKIDLKVYRSLSWLFILCILSQHVVLIMLLLSDFTWHFKSICGRGTGLTGSSDVGLILGHVVTNKKIHTRLVVLSVIYIRTYTRRRIRLALPESSSKESYMYMYSVCVFHLNKPGFFSGIICGFRTSILFGSLS